VISGGIYGIAFGPGFTLQVLAFACAHGATAHAVGFLLQSLMHFSESEFTELKNGQDFVNSLIPQILLNKKRDNAMHYPFSYTFK
jgi:hypothetical protein